MKKEVEDILREFEEGWYDLAFDEDGHQTPLWHWFREKLGQIAPQSI